MTTKTTFILLRQCKHIQFKMLHTFKPFNIIKRNGLIRTVQWHQQIKFNHTIFEALQQKQYSSGMVKCWNRNIAPD